MHNYKGRKANWSINEYSQFAFFLSTPSIEGNNGYILVTANGGINQQRVAVSILCQTASFYNDTSELFGID